MQIYNNELIQIPYNTYIHINIRKICIKNEVMHLLLSFRF